MENGKNDGSLSSISSVKTERSSDENRNNR